jgi:uroporphyrinogen decarboxylase
MTHRERVLCTLNHEQPDKMAIDFGAMRSTGINAIAYNRLRRYLKLPVRNTRVYDLFQQLAEPELDILERFGADVVQLHRLCPSFGVAIQSWRPDTLSDGSPCLVPVDFHPQLAQDSSLEIWENGHLSARRPAEGYWYDSVFHALENATTTLEISAHTFGTISEEEQAFLSKESKRLHEETDFAILGEFGANLLESGQGDFGYARFMEMMIADRELVECYLDRLVENHLRNLEIYLRCVQDRIQVIQLGDDFGTQEALQLSPRLYRELFKPRQEKIFRYIHDHSRMKIFLHSCGAIYDILGDLVDIGLDIINPVQISSPNMNPDTLKKEFGKHLTFWGGGCDTQHVLPRADMSILRQHVADNIRAFSPGGGYVFTQVHNIQQEIEAERIVAMYDTALQNRG